MSHDAAVRDFLAKAEFAAPGGKPIVPGRGAAAAERPAVVFDTAPQAVAAGAQLIQFDDKVGPDLRAAITNSMLAAQLTANKQVASGPVDTWYKSYFDTLSLLGWTTSGVSRTLQKFDSKSADVNKAIIGFITAAMPGLGTAALIVEALKSLQSMAADEPWIALFDHYSRHASYSAFQVAFGTMTGAQPSLKLFSFVLDTDIKQVQVLFFKFGSTHASLRQTNGAVFIEPAALLKNAPGIQAKLDAKQTNFIANLDF